MEFLYAYRRAHIEERKDGIGWEYDCHNDCDKDWDRGFLVVLLDSSPLMLWDESRASVVDFMLHAEEGGEQGAGQTNSQDQFPKFC